MCEILWLSNGQPEAARGVAVSCWQTTWLFLCPKVVSRGHNHTCYEEEGIDMKFTFAQMQEAIAAGFERNAVVYDSNGSGLTLRLVSLMKTVQRGLHDSCDLPLDTIYIGTKQFIEHFDDGDECEEIVIRRVTILPFEGLDKGDPLYTYYMAELKGCLPRPKDQLAIGVVRAALTGDSIQKSTILLGAF